MRSLSFFALFAILCGHVPAQTTSVLKDKNNRLIDSLKVPSAKTLTIESGATLNVTGATLTGFPSTSAAWADITGKPTTLAGYGITDAITAATAASTYAPLMGPNFSGTISAEELKIFEDGTDAFLSITPSTIRIKLDGLGSTSEGVLGSADLTTDRVWQLPDASGTLALTSALSALNASNLTSGTLPIARIADSAITNAKLAGSIDLSKLDLTGNLQVGGSLFSGGASGSSISIFDRTITHTHGPTGRQANLFFPNFATVSSNRNYLLPDNATGSTQTIVTQSDTGTVTNAMLAGSIALSKLAITGTPDGTKFIRDDGSWQTITSGATLGANTFTALQSFSGTNHAGLRLNNLTTAERDALTGSAGMVIWNTTDGRMQLHNGSAWTSGMVRLAGDTMTGALGITAGTLATSPLSITQTFNGGAGVTHRGIEYAVTNTSSNAASTVFRILTGASGSTVALSVNAATGATVIGASNNSATLTLQGSDRSAVFALGDFGSEFKVANLQIGASNARLRFVDGTASTRYGTIYGEAANVLALRDGSGGTTGAAWEMLEMTAPGTPAADRIRLYVEDNGSGKSRLVIKWADGTTSVLATQP
jgi:hypothetical protein